jgi:hypothetical protein
VTAWAALRGLGAAPPGGRERWDRTNHRGQTLTLLEGPAYVLGALAALCVPGTAPASVRAAAAVAATGAGAFGAVDDLTESGSSKGLRGHLGELARGRLTTGGLKVVGIGVTGLVAAAMVLSVEDAGASPTGARRSRVLRGAVDTAVAGALVAGTANLVNLLDLRPGRALKVTVVGGCVIGAGASGGIAAAAGGAAAGLLADDMSERSMLGDTGANAAGAVLGTALVSRLGRRGRLAALATVVTLTLASEKVSFTKVIEGTPGLRELDALGRRPA